MDKILRSIFIGACLLIGTLYAIYGGMIAIGVMINSWGWAGFFGAPVIALALLGAGGVCWYRFITSILKTKESK